MVPSAERQLGAVFRRSAGVSQNLVSARRQLRRARRRNPRLARASDTCADSQPGTFLSKSARFASGNLLVIWLNSIIRWPSSPLSAYVVLCVRRKDTAFRQPREGPMQRGECGGISDSPGRGWVRCPERCPKELDGCVRWEYVPVEKRPDRTLEAPGRT